MLGPLGVFNDGGQVPLGGRRQRSVLAGLVVNAGATLSAERLISLVWGENPPATARKSLQVYVSRLRRALGASIITHAPAGYSLDVEATQIDVFRFEDLAEKARQRLSTDPQTAFDLLEDALALWRGSPLSDIDPDGDLIPYIEHLTEGRMAAIEDRNQAGLDLGRHAELIGELRLLVDGHPLRERLWAQLMVALYRSGRQAEALRAFQRCRQILAEELGIEPSLPLKELEERILQQDPGLQLETAIPPVEPDDELPPIRIPYKGRLHGERRV